jgi:hypothetical protein
LPDIDKVRKQEADMRDCARRVADHCGGVDCHLPVLLLTVFALRPIVAGLTAGAVKGG